MPAFQVKIVGDRCNLRCSYCRNREFDQDKITLMNTEVLDSLFRIVATLQQKIIRICWHGGEPLLAGLDFFEKIVAHERKLVNKQFINSVQTNATLITNNWANFFVKNRFRIGVSIDGSEVMHNLNRKNISGKESYTNAMRGVKILRSFGIKPGSICTITRNTISLATEGFLSLVKNGFTGISFNTFYNTASCPNKTDESVSDSEWTIFLKRIFDEWLKINSSNLRVREIDQVLAWVNGLVANNCAFKGTCANWFVIDWDGSIYPCERLGRMPLFGNVNDVPDLNQILMSRSFIHWKCRLKILPDVCHKCSFLRLCNNGCVAHRNSENIPQFVYCNSRLAFFDYIKNRLG